MERLGMRFERLARGDELGLRQLDVEVVLYGLEREVPPAPGGARCGT
jgi:hypothetical protein